MKTTFPSFSPPPSLGRRPLAPPTAAPARPTPARQPAIAPGRALVAQRPAPAESLWYRLKRAVLDVICNLDLPRPFATRTLGQGVPDGLEARMKPGDVLLRRTEGTSGNLFIPSWWKHAAVYVGDGMVIEATFDGVKRTPLAEFFAHGDHATVLRGKNLTASDRQAVVRYANSQEGKPYDFDMDFDDDARLSCTELAYHALRVGAKREVVGQNWLGAVVGDDFLGARFEVVYTSAPEHMEDLAK